VISLVVAPLAFYFRPPGSGIVAVTSLKSFLLGPWYTWDVRYYVEIVRNGYLPGRPTANFHPLYPWISALLAAVTREPLLSLLLVSSIAGLLFVIIFYRLARLDCDEQQAWQATALLLCWPASLALFLPYTEALFLLLSVYCLFAARQQRFWLAGLAGALATLTRQQGLFLVLPLAWEIWEASDRRWSSLVKSSLSLFFIPAAYALWVVYRAVAINDVHPDFSSIQNFLHTVMISPSSYEITERHAFLPPWLTIWKGLSVFVRGEVSPYAYIDLLLGAAFIAFLVLGWRYLRMSYRVYCVAIVLVSLSFYAADENPFLALPRHMLLAFPVFIGLAARYQFKRFPFWLSLLVECQMGLLVCFVWYRWVP
jgi:4-amino-4-deoxy-L-arabinose transferase-like glycosyltransferase